MKSEVAEHFNLRNHNFLNNLKIIIFKANIENLDIRESIEDELMYLCDYTGLKILNLKRRKINYVKHFLTYDLN